MGKGLSNKYGQKLLDSAKKSTTDAIKTASKRAIQKTAVATGDLIVNKITDKVTGLHSKKPNNNNNEDVEFTTHKNDTYLQEKENKLLMNWDWYLKNMYKSRYISLKKITNYW